MVNTCSCIEIASFRPGRQIVLVVGRKPELLTEQLMKTDYNPRKRKKKYPSLDIVLLAKRC